jgi:hypothetical protein
MIFLTECLRRPDQQIVIPTHRIGRGHFPPEYCRAFWQRILFNTETPHARIRVMRE